MARKSDSQYLLEIYPRIANIIRLLGETGEWVSDEQIASALAMQNDANEILENKRHENIKQHGIDKNRRNHDPHSWKVNVVAFFGAEYTKSLNATLKKKLRIYKPKQEYGFQSSWCLEFERKKDQKRRTAYRLRRGKDLLESTPHFESENSLPANSWQLMDKTFEDFQALQVELSRQKLKLGRLGEALVNRWLNNHGSELNILKYEWTANVYPKSPYDFHIWLNNQEVLLDVKTTVDSLCSPFYLSIREIELILDSSIRYDIYRVSNANLITQTGILSIAQDVKKGIKDKLIFLEDKPKNISFESIRFSHDIFDFEGKYELTLT
jgi:hypothetical protein